MTDQGSQFTVQTSLSTLNEERQSNTNEFVETQEQENISEADNTLRNTHQYVNDEIPVSDVTSTLLGESIVEDDDVFNESDEFDEADPLNIRSLAEHFDALISEINIKTNDLATQVYNHVKAKKHNNDIEIEAINIRLSEMRRIINNSNQLNTEIDKLDQLRVYTREFKHRIKSIEQTLKEKELSRRRQRQ